MLNPDLKSMSAQMSMYSEQQIAVPPPPLQSRDPSSTRNNTYRLQIGLMALTLREQNTYVAPRCFD
ncbi:hypothetical protein ANO14919_142850 [Xylariales sp. No.14919]|nr:hypothetical protein ANO14919_142850 [Xylariales sp. No.14919]